MLVSVFFLALVVQGHLLGLHGQDHHHHHHHSSSLFKIGNCEKLYQKVRSISHRIRHNHFYSVFNNSVRGHFVVDDSYQLFLPCHTYYRGAEKELESLFPLHDNQVVLSITGMDLLDDKITLPIRLKNLDIYPPSYDFSNTTQMELFMKYPPSMRGTFFKQFIAKSDVHGQAGLKLFNSFEEVKEFYQNIPPPRNRQQNPYHLLQPLISHHLMRDSQGRWNALRIYVPVSCSLQEGMAVSYHPWIRMKYGKPNTKKAGDLLTVNDIATFTDNSEGLNRGLIDYCERFGHDYQSLIKLIENLLLRFFDAVHGDICTPYLGSQTSKMGQIFGGDILIRQDFRQVWLLEMNKAPTMLIKKKEDDKYKQLVVSSFYRHLGLPCLPDDGDPFHHLIPLKKYPLSFKPHK